MTNIKYTKNEPIECKHNGNWVKGIYANPRTGTDLHYVKTFKNWHMSVKLEDIRKEQWEPKCSLCLDDGEINPCGTDKCESQYSELFGCCGSTVKCPDCKQKTNKGGE